jgi:hypothetical protein
MSIKIIIRMRCDLVVLVGRYGVVRLDWRDEVRRHNFGSLSIDEGRNIDKLRAST